MAEPTKPVTVRLRVGDVEQLQLGSVLEHAVATMAAITTGTSGRRRNSTIEIPAAICTSPPPTASSDRIGPT